MNDNHMRAIPAIGLAMAVSLAGCSSPKAGHEPEPPEATPSMSAASEVIVNDAMPPSEGMAGGIWVLSSYDTAQGADPASRSHVEYEIDEHGNVLAERDSEAGETYESRYAYDADGYRISYTSPESGEETTVSHEADADGRLLSEANGYGTRVTYSYDGDLLASTHREEGRFSYDTGYDESGRISSTRSSDGYEQSMSYEEDGDGIPVKASITSSSQGGMPRVTHIAYEHDENGNITKATFSDEGGDAIKTVTYEYSYVPEPSRAAPQYSRTNRLPYVM